MILYLHTGNLNSVTFKLLEGKKVVAEKTVSLGLHDGHKIVPMLQKFLTKQGLLKVSKDSLYLGNDKKTISSSPIKAIHLYAGEGSYTGLRIGNAIAQGLSLVLNVPVKIIKYENKN